MPYAVCLGAKGEPCGVLTTRKGGRCDVHKSAAKRGRSGAYRSHRWRKLSQEVIAAWTREHGWLCPGWHRAPHPSRDLTTDHVVGLAAGGAAFDRRNLAVLCRGCNTAKGNDGRRRRPRR